MTDNKKRTVAEIRHIFLKHGGNLGENGCVSWMFEKKGSIIINKKDVDEDTLVELVLDGGGEDVVELENEYEVITDPNAFEDVKEALVKAGIKNVFDEISMIPQTTVKLDEQKAIPMLKLMEQMEDNDDVQHVYANFDIPDAIMEKLSQSM